MPCPRPQAAWQPRRVTLAESLNRLVRRFYRFGHWFAAQIAANRLRPSQFGIDCSLLLLCNVTSPSLSVTVQCYFGRASGQPFIAASQSHSLGPSCKALSNTQRRARRGKLGTRKAREVGREKNHHNRRPTVKTSRAIRYWETKYARMLSGG